MTMKSVTSFIPRNVAVLIAGLLVSIQAPYNLPAQIDGGAEEDPIEQELRYADGLMQMGMADYAKIVLNRLDPSVVGPRMKVLKLKSYLAVGDFDTVWKLIKQEPNPNSKEAWAMKLALADGYYAWGKYQEATNLYEKFFKQHPGGPSKGLEKFYLESAYKYAQMLILMDKPEYALKAYNYALKAAPKKNRKKSHIRRQLLGEKMELLMKIADTNPSKRNACKAQIKKIFDEIFWIQDLWFGKAVVVMAHLKKLEGDLEGAKKLIDDYTRQLLEIDKYLEEDQKRTGDNLMRLSPMAQCRYLLGVMMHDEAQKASKAGDRSKVVKLLVGEKTNRGRLPGALQHLMTVFAKYPYTSWAPEAGKRAREIQELLETEYGLKISINMSAEAWEKVRNAQFMQARSLYGQRRFEEAAERYIEVLNLFPEGESAISALGDLVRCYMELGDAGNEIYADMVLRYIAERFSRNESLQIKAGDMLAKLAGEYAERGRQEKEETINKLFFQKFDNHPRVPALVYGFGKKAFEAKDYNTALGYFKRIIKKHKDSRIYEIALSKAAQCEAELGNLEKQEGYLEKLTSLLKEKGEPGHEYIATRYRLIGVQQKIAREYRDKDIEDAEKKFNQAMTKATKGYLLLEKVLNKAGEKLGPYQPSTEEVEKNRKIASHCLFYQARGFSMLTMPTNRVDTFKKVAVKKFEQFVKKYPDSELAPAALAQVGTLYTMAGNTEKSQGALTELQKKYPGSREAKNVLFMLANNLLELGMRKKAIEMFKQMFGDEAGKYSEGQILSAGLQLEKAGEHEIALDAFEQVLKKTKKKSLHQRALLGKGKCMCELGKYAESAEALEKWMEKYPKSAGLTEAAFCASRAYAEMARNEADDDKRFDLFNKAIVAMRTMRLYDKSAAGRAKSDIGVARIHLLRSQAEEKFGTPEKAEKARADAIVTLQSLVFFVNRDKPGVKPHLEEAYYILIPLLLELEKWQDALNNCDEYMKSFPVGPKYLSEVRRWRVKANMKAKVEKALDTSVSEQPEETPPETGKDAE